MNEQTSNNINLFRSLFKGREDVFAVCWEKGNKSGYMPAYFMTFIDFVYMNFKLYIEIHPEKRFGKPIIKGTRIAVVDVLNWLANGMSREEIIADFPELSMEQINACLFFAASRENNRTISLN